MKAPRTDQTTADLAAKVKQAVEAAQRDSQLLDSPTYDEGRWQAVFDALAELEARASGRRTKPGVLPSSASSADRSLEESPLKLGELEVIEAFAEEGVVLRPSDYMRLVQVIRQQHDALVAADEEAVVGIA